MFPSGKSKSAAVYFSLNRHSHHSPRVLGLCSHSCATHTSSNTLTPPDGSVCKPNHESNTLCTRLRGLVLASMQPLLQMIILHLTHGCVAALFVTCSQLQMFSCPNCVQGTNSSSCHIHRPAQSRRGECHHHPLNDTPYHLLLGGGDSNNKADHVLHDPL